MDAMGQRRKFLPWAVLAVVLAAVSAPAATDVPPQEPQPAGTAEKLPAAEVQALKRLRQIVTALETYRALYRAYPLSLAQLGPPEEGSPSQDAANLISARLAAGEAGEYVVEYFATEPAARGGAAAYEVRAVPREFTGAPQRSFFVDPGGRVRYTLEKRKAKREDLLFEHPAYSPEQVDEEDADADEEAASAPPTLERGEQATLFRVKRVVQALEIYRKRHGGYPPALAYLGPPEAGPPTEKAARLLSGQLAGGAAEGYRFVYRARSASGVIEEYELKVMPEEYERTGRVSFYADQSGTIRATSENRDPGPADPIIE
jgi:hypothetical protein